MTCNYMTCSTCYQDQIDAVPALLIFIEDSFPASADWQNIKCPRDGNSNTPKFSSHAHTVLQNALKVPSCCLPQSCISKGERVV
eukprot:scaffold208004_cov23-Tisochrysis_lutea.AAC.1